MSQRLVLPIVAASLIGCATAFAFSLLTGCGGGALATENSLAGSATMSGVLLGGSNPVVGATMRLYVTATSYPTASSDYAAVATTLTTAGGAFAFTLPTGNAVCPAGSYAYVTAFSGSTGATTFNTGSLLMVPVGACSSNYTNVAGVNTYTGSNLMINEITTAVSAYALGSFMTVTNPATGADANTVVVNIGAPANNTATPSSTVGSAAAAGLAHAFANALALVNISTGMPNSYTGGGTSSTGGVVPVAELLTIGNILQACVNTAGLSTTAPVTPTATANDGTSCGKLYSLTTPPVAVPGTSTPTNTMAAILDLAKYPKPTVNTWNSTCTTAGSGTTTANSCLFGLPTALGAAYVGGLVTTAPPDWALAVVFPAGFGANTTSTACTATNASCPGLSYPFYVALDYADNVYVLNYDSLNTSGAYVGATTGSNILGFTNSGAPVFSTVQDTTNKYIETIGTDGANHVFGANTTAATGTTANNVMVYNTMTTSSSAGSAAPGSLAINTYYNNAAPRAVIADPFNNIYIASVNSINLRKLAYSTSSSSPYIAYTISNVTGVTTPPSNVYQMGFNSTYDLYQLSAAAGTTTTVYLTPNTGYATLTSAPTYSASTTGVVNATVTGSSSAAAGLAVGTNGAYVIDANTASTAAAQETMIVKTGTGSSATIAAGAVTTIAPVVTGYPGNRYAAADGNNWVYSVDAGVGATGSTPQVSGVDVVDTVDAINLGPYEGCAVVVSTSKCGTGVSGAPAAVVSPRGAVIDSAGDIWIISGGSVSAGTGFGMTEMIGAAAPAWPGLSLAKTGLPQ